tara:strand:+ start:135 stop:569 length:435 start_codon:yes stop_codon:yes gene_type:complete
MKKVCIINGPNLNLLGNRENQIYGTKSIQDIEKDCLNIAKQVKLEIIFFQSNSEGEIINQIQQSTNFDFLIINAGALTHTSLAIYDALKMLKIPIIEVHISNIYKREDFRKNSFISPLASGIIVGFGTSVYELAIKSLLYLETK